ncbi:MAG: chaperone modulator CbpM [Azonexus sp.]|jgi:chaperone modulatory protein CbpM|nr:chaperone modulator CbpM [Betaproteobacteria bacterium]MBK8918674.1 chaperone modulator CbpM [Betaproteobacteria bacterium]MBP6034607.1 chaperone modulator CbpM [Azonexus sp.]MBP6905147.1 chaperone modulator CbpM [Azonexus sp.]
METPNRLPQVSAVILEEQGNLTLADLGHACAVQAEFIVDLVQEGVLAPAGEAPHRWRFNGAHLVRATVAFRLQRDLGVNLPGAALALQLLDEIEALQARLRALGADPGPSTGTASTPEQNAVRPGGRA